jgi:ribose transport system substrate-binding protein
MKKTLIACLSVLLLVAGVSTVFATGGKEAAKKEPVIGMAVINLDHPFFANFMAASLLAQQDYGVRTIWKSAEGSLEKQIAIIENFIQQKVDCILIDPIDKKAIIPVIYKIHEAGIPVITSGNFVDTPYNVNTLYNDYEDFKTLTTMMGYYLNKKGNVVCLVGGPGNFVSDERQRGFEDGVKQFPDIKVLSIQPSDWDQVKGMKVMENWLTAYPNIDAFLCVSDGVTLGALEPIRASGRAKDIKIFTYDGDIQSQQLVQKGEMVADLLTGSGRVGYFNIAIASMLARGQKVPQKVYIKTHFIITKDTAKILQDRGMDFSKIDWVTPEEGMKIFYKGAAEFGPGKLSY